MTVDESMVDGMRPRSVGPRDPANQDPFGISAPTPTDEPTPNGPEYGTKDRRHFSCLNEQLKCALHFGAEDATGPSCPVRVTEESGTVGCPGCLKVGPGQPLSWTERIVSSPTRSTVQSVAEPPREGQLHDEWRRWAQEHRVVLPQRAGCVREAPGPARDGQPASDSDGPVNKR